MPHRPEKRMLTLAEALARLGVSRPTFDKMCREGWIRQYWLPSGRRRFPVQDINQVLSRRRPPGHHPGHQLANEG